MNRLLVALKIGGTASLGILTGVHLNFSLETLRAITALPSAAQKAFTIALGLLRSTVRTLEIAATASLATAWLLAPKHGKHPYLWFASVPVVLSVGIERLRLAGVEYGIMSTPTSTSNEVEVNGEVVRKGVDDWRRWGLIRGGIIGSGFLLALVGLYGDFA
ncbi:hypothetical protein FN846DRAFT_37082 [Sphaerosporella brunnea]|uniref:DUF1772-domain-containing protein n=1 Tax=Sphaerosporella brunnea TaxID=1250544 RepID=A0A5J5FA12_9PEZI|nr:hypothetical protein FN846DRAFT_37082 [Sphaerosporella brunnea]